jgi:TolA-binding protein
MAVLRRWVLVLTILLAGGLRLGAASKEDNAFDAARREMQPGTFDRAEAQFADFVQAYTNSPRLAEAVLCQAEARLSLGQAEGAWQLLSNRLAQAGKWTPHYLFWSGRALAQKGNYRAAADTFGKMLQGFPASAHGPEAAVEQALACSKLGEWTRVIELLQQPNGAFQTTIRTNAPGEPAQRGWLLLSEAWLRQTNSPQKLASAEAALQPLANLALKPEIGWDRQYLLCRIQLGNGRTNEALLNTTNLLAIAAQTGQRALQADTFAFRASLLEGLGRLEEAIAAYTNNLAEGSPPESQREALLQSTRLYLAQTNRIPEAIQSLERFVTQYSNAPAADLGLLTLGGLHLRQRVAGLSANELDALPLNAPGPTNAIARLNELVERFPHSPYAGKAQLYLGWCFWLEGRLAEAQTNFQAAAQQLPAPSLDQATACFKLADAQFGQGNVRGALTNYSRVVEQCAASPEAKADLLESALYQIVHAGLAAGELPAATNAMAKLLVLFPEGFHTAPAVLLAGQALARRGTPAGARELFASFAARATNASLLPQVQLALARTWEEENNWTNAIGQYTSLLTNCPDSGALALAKFYRAQATWRAGNLTNALMLYTDFVAHHASHPKAPLAQFWIGDYYFNLGNWSAAELSYQQLCEGSNWQGSELVNPAWMMAGRAAFQQHLWSNATNDFTKVFSNPNCPSDLLVEATFAYGDCLRSQLSKEKADPSNADRLWSAVNIFGRIYLAHPIGPQGLLALGAKAEALVQLAQVSGNNNYYTNALNAYGQIITNAAADVVLRSMAKVGLAMALQMQAEQKTGAEQTELLKQALNQCLDVARGTFLGADEKANPDWTVMAGDKAIGLAETLQAWTEAINLCNELANLFLPLQARYLEKAKNLAAKQANTGAKP